MLLSKRTDKFIKENKNILSDKASLEINGYKLPFYICKYIIIEAADAVSDETVNMIEKTNHQKSQFNINSTVLGENEALKIIRQWKDNIDSVKNKYTFEI